VTPSSPPVLDELSRVFTKLTPPQQRVADHILRHPELVIAATVTDICEATSTSEPVLFAVCRAVGRKGYKALRMDITGEVAVLQARRLSSNSTIKNGGPDVDLSAGERGDALARRIGAVYLESVQAAIECLNGENFARAVKLISSANKVAIFGMGTSGHIARIGEYALMRAGVTVNCSTDSYVQLAQVAGLKKGDVALGISYVGEQPETVQVMKLARQVGAHLLAITCRTDSPLGREADLVLEVPPRRPLASYVSIGARIAAAELYVIDALAAAVALEHEKEFNERTEIIREALESRKDTETNFSNTL
jgi:RpiR family transcriptional regulator, carbohydrate utilization regulator